jgi:periplasmic iron binding protein
MSDKAFRLISRMAASAIILVAPSAFAREFFVGGPVHKNDMEIVANYLVGIEMAPMMKDMLEGPDVIHLEADVHATADNVYGYPDGAWIAYLTINYTVTKQGSDWKASGTLKPMTAKDGPHYAENVKMSGSGTYTVTYSFAPPEANGFYRHIDKETGVSAWWKPFSESFTFTYPQK